jgi:hypothetical protein
MTKVIIISGGNLDSYYEQVQQYLHAKYHTYPSNLLPLNISESERAQQGYYDAMARYSSAEADGYSIEVPIGKLVV